MRTAIEQRVILPDNWRRCGARVEISRDGKASGEKREVRVEAWRWRMFRICMLLLYGCRADDTSKSNREQKQQGEQRRIVQIVFL
jgi:hypothetical protein